MLVASHGGAGGERAVREGPAEACNPLQPMTPSQTPHMLYLADIVTLWLHINGLVSGCRHHIPSRCLLRVCRMGMVICILSVEA